MVYSQSNNVKAPKTMADKKKITHKAKPEINYDNRVKLYEDGKYHWVYDLNLLKNPSVFIDVFKMLGMTIFIFGIILFLIQACSGNMSFKDMGFVLKITGLMAAIFAVLGILGYLLYAAMSGWTYSVHFIMDEKGVVHEEAPKTKKVAKWVGFLTAMVGLFSRKPGVVGSGMLGASHMSMSTDFAVVRKVKALRRMNTVMVNETFSKNRVYVTKEDFDFVYDYISSRCPKAKIK